MVGLSGLALNAGDDLDDPIAVRLQKSDVESDDAGAGR